MKRGNKLFYALILIIYFMCGEIVSMSTTNCNKLRSEIVSPKYHDGKMEYPYVANHDRKMLIKDHYQKIKKGMSSTDVIKTLTLPDVINLTYEPIIRNPRCIGFNYEYVLQRLSYKGSVNEKKEIYVRIHFDIDKKVSEIVWSSYKHFGSL